MSSAILLAANPTLARLQRYLTEQPTIRIPAADASQVELHDFYEDEQVFEYAVRQISEAIRTLEHLHDKWLNYLSNLSGSEAQRATEFYETMTSSADGMVHVVDRGKEALNRLRSHEHRIKAILSRLNEESGSDSAAEVPNVNKENSSLLQIDLKDFSGNPMEWPQFWSFFQADLDRQPVSAIQKFNYLICSLKGRL
uniref:Syntaxin-6_N domain-containing protein n=1 Tax=Gongylonema pulchrum TaxID=637853 RepID=A0A183EXE2_9BILA